MRIVLTGSSGRVGRAIYNALAPWHEVVGLDRTPFSTTRLVADFVNPDLLTSLLRGADAVIHTAALHAPHVGIVSEAEFHRINVEGTRLLLQAARKAQVPRFVFTSTTALFGQTIRDGRAAWVNDDTIPVPRTIYHSTKLEAESLLRESACESLAVRVIRMSRCFPERADIMVLHRIARGVDVRDVASAHVAALTNEGAHYQSYIVSGETPFLPEDCSLLASDPASALLLRAPAVHAVFRQRGWTFPAHIDRVYDSSQAQTSLGWVPRFGFEEVVAQLDRGSIEVLSA